MINKIFSGDISSNNYLENRLLFKAFNNKCVIKVQNSGIKAADFFINGKNIDISCDLKQDSFEIKLDNLLKDGNNSLKILNIQPGSSSLEVSIDYPVLCKADPSEVGFDPGKLKIIDELISAEVDDGFPGAVLLIIKDAKIVKETAYGFKKKYADDGSLLDEFDSMDTNTIFDIASNSKMYSTNFALMKLASEGKIDVNKRIKDYIKEYTGDGRDEVLVKNLLTHSAGYAPEVLFYIPDNETGPQFYSINREKTIKLLTTEVPFIYKKGEKTQYSDTDYMLLGLIIESVTGMKQDEYVEKEIYQPLGLTNTMYVPLQKGKLKENIAATEINGTTRGFRRDYPEIRKTVLQGEVHDEKAFYSMGQIAGHAGLFSTVNELAVLTQTVLNGGGYGEIKLFDKNILDQFIKPSDFDITFGLGWRRAGNAGLIAHFGPYASSSTVGHTGWTGTFTLMDPEHNLSIVLLTNKKHSEMIGNDPFPLEKFKGDGYLTGQYGTIVSMIYEAFLEN